MDPSDVTLLGRVDGKQSSATGKTPVGKKRPEESPKPSKKKSNCKPSTEDLKSLDDKWAERVARLEVMILAKSFAVPVEPVMKPTELITRDFFNPGAGTSQTSTGGVSDVSLTGASPVQAIGEVAANMTATQPVEAPGTRRGDVISQTATQPVEASGAGPEVWRTGSTAVHLDQSLTGGKTADHELSEEATYRDSDHS